MKNEHQKCLRNRSMVWQVQSQSLAVPLVRPIWVWEWEWEAVVDAGKRRCVVEEGAVPYTSVQPVAILVVNIQPFPRHPYGGVTIGRNALIQGI